MSDAIVRSRIRAALLEHSSQVGLGLRCSHCGQEKGGDWQEDIRNAFNPDKNGFNKSVQDTQRKIDASNAIVKNEFVNPQSLLRKGVDKVAHEIFDGDSDFNKKIMPAIDRTLNTVEKVAKVAKLVGMGAPKKGAWSPEAKARAQARAKNPHSHASKVKAYMKKHNCSLAEASKAVSK
jgi:hypothetical protein